MAEATNVVTGPTSSRAGADRRVLSDTPAQRGVRTWSRFVVYVPAIVVAIGGWAYRWVDEDAFINFRIVDNIFAGHGPVFNAGERVEAATSPLWLAILVIARALFGTFVSMPWIALVASLLAAVAAFVLGGRAARVVHRDEDGVVVPVGLLAVSAVAVVWEFATSGLEMGLVWLWLAACWLALVTVARMQHDFERSRSRAGWCVVIGLGPLVRPELTVTMLCFVVGWLLLARPRRVARDLTAMFALPVAYEVFRMGYYANLVPNTALAKDASGAHFGQGWNYAVDLLRPYWLWVPLALGVAIVVVRTRRARDRRLAIAAAAMFTGAALDALYIVATGGDYMHGRLLLPALFAFALPVSVCVEVTSAWGRVLTALTAVVVAWAVVALVALRPPRPPTAFAVADVSDWRQVSKARIIPADVDLGISGSQAHALYKQGVRGYFRTLELLPHPAKNANALVLTLGSIGVPAWRAGADVWVIDIGGLAEPLAARTAPQPNRPAGHRKQVDQAWYDARFGAEPGDEKVAAARRALDCGPVRDLMEAVDGHLTIGRFFSNIWHSPMLTRLQVPYDPVVAERRWCPPPRG